MAGGCWCRRGRSRARKPPATSRSATMSRTPGEPGWTRRWWKTATESPRARRWTCRSSVKPSSPTSNARSPRPDLQWAGPAPEHRPGPGRPGARPSPVPRTSPGDRPPKQGVVMSYTSKPDPVDVIVVGMGGTGGTAVKVLCEAGLKVVGFDKGPWLRPQDHYSGDELKFVNRNYLWPDPSI